MHTDPSQQTCSSTWLWFASTLQSAMLNRIARRKRSNCTNLTRFAYSALRDLSQLKILQLFRHSTWCYRRLPARPIFKPYCFVDAAHASNPSDLYFFQLLWASLCQITPPRLLKLHQSLMALLRAIAGKCAKGNINESGEDLLERAKGGQCAMWGEYAQAFDGD